MTASVLKQDPNTKRFKPTLIYFNTDRETDRQTDRQRQTESKRDTQRETERERQRETHRDRDRQTERDTERQRETVCTFSGKYPLSSHKPTYLVFGSVFAACSVLERLLQKLNQNKISLSLSFFIFF